MSKLLTPTLTLVEASEPIDLRKVDFQKEYNHWNRVLFNSELPVIPIKLSKSKDWTGLTTYNKSTGKIGMKISNLLKITKTEFSSVLVHEMIHVFFFASGNVKEIHGSVFKKMASDLSKKAGFKISITHDVTKSDIDDTVAKSKELDFVLFKSPGGLSISLFGKGKFPLKDFENTFDPSKYSGGLVFSFGTGTTNLYNKFKVNRKLNRPAFFGLTDEQEKELLKNSKIHKVIKT